MHMKGRNLTMARESMRRAKMQSAQAVSEYVGAFIEDERRLTLVAIDPTEPWEAFRALRRQMRRESKAADASMGLYASADPIEHSAKIISLESRRRAG
jgi:hypothetical protein